MSMQNSPPGPVDGPANPASSQAFREDAARQIALARRHRYDLATLVFAIDGLDALRDRLGQAAVDEVLKAAGDALALDLRASDLMGRIGEDFAVVMPHSGRSGGIEAAERLRATVARTRMRIGNEIVTVTASVGGAVLDPAGGGIEALLAQAGAALREATEGGRSGCLFHAAAVPVQTGRRRVLKAGRITFNAGRSTIDCTVRWLSETDATLSVANAVGIPDSFKLQIEADGLSRQCRVVERREGQIDVGFENPAEPSRPT